MKRRILTAILMLLMIFQLCACGSAADAPATGATPEPVAESTPEAAPETPAPFLIYDEFKNNDGDISFKIDNAAFEELPETMPLIRVTQMFVTPDMAKAAAEAIFGDNTLYEYCDELTKDEVAEMIAVWEYGVTDTAIRESHGQEISNEDLESVRQVRQELLDYYRNAYEYASDELTPRECLWRFWPAAHYEPDSYSYAGTDVSFGDDVPYDMQVEIKATVTMDELPYHFSASNFERVDFRNHSIFAYIVEMSPKAGAYESWLQETRLYSETEATQAQLDFALEKAAVIAEKLGTGHWELSASNTQAEFATLVDENTGDLVVQNQIRIDGRPVYEGLPVLATSGSSDYYDEELRMFFTNYGRLDSFTLLAQHDIEETSTAKVLSGEELLSRIKSALEDLPFDENWTIPGWPGADAAEIAITDISLGLVRQSIDSTYFELYPAVVVKGEVHVYDKDGNDIYSWHHPNTPECIILTIDLRV